MNISLKSTKTTPKAIISDGYIHIEGRSIPLGDSGFYRSLVNLILEYADNPPSVTMVDIDLNALMHIRKNQ
ncbi:MAG: DUF1987 domain-containing protein [Bacteroidales bacterium]|nr:DUF1987 domain-containing protein [Bacteroidales bacterium]